MDRNLTDLDFRIFFESSPGLYLVLTPSFKIVAVTAAYLRATLTKREEILGRNLFEVFPDNPNDPTATGTRNLRSSLETVLKTCAPDIMAVQKYDIPRPEAEGGGFEVRFWSPVNSPILGSDGQARYIIHRVEDVTEFVRLKQRGAEQSKLNEELKTQAGKMESEVFERAQEIQAVNRRLSLANEELKKKEGELTNLYEKLKDADELKTQFFANVSHELRTPLALIFGPAEQLLSEGANLTDDQTRKLRVIERNSKTLLKHVNDLLDISKLEAGRLKPRYADVDLVKLVRVVAGHFETIMQTRSIFYSLQAPRSVRAQVDPEKLQRVVMNLLSNAIKFVPNGGRIECNVEETSDGHVLIAVQDTGPGVKPEMRALIFERFRQGEDGPARKYSGTGLGLAIVKEFVEMHGGHVSVSDAPNRGALFTVKLPRKAPHGVTVEADTGFGKTANLAIQGSIEELKSQARAPIQSEDAPPAPGKPSVLVCEDNPDMRAYVADILKSDFNVATASDGLEGLEKTERLMPDLVVSDIMMPRLSGDQLVQEIRCNPRISTIPVLLLSAKADDELRVKLLKEGANDYVMKPFGAEELKARVQNLVMLKKAREVLEQELALQSDDLVVLAKEAAVRKRELQTALETTTIAREQAERASQAKGTFLSLVSHEVHTPLTSILLSLQMLKKRGVAPENQKNWDRIFTSCTRLRSLIESLLDYTRMESGGLITRFELFDLKALLQEIIVDVEIHAAEKGIELKYCIDPALPEIKNDTRIVRVIINNLLSNAVKYTDHGFVHLKIWHDERGHVIEVKDTGLGIAKENHAKIFEPFEQLTSLRQKSLPGVGLGLALVKELVTALCGKVLVSSELGQGSTFTVILPPPNNDVGKIGLAGWIGSYGNSDKPHKDAG